MPDPFLVFYFQLGYCVDLVINLENGGFMTFEASVYLGVSLVGGPLAGSAVTSRYMEMSAGRGILYGLSFAVADLAVTGIGLRDVVKIFGAKNFDKTSTSQAIAGRAVCQVVSGVALFLVFKVFQRAITWQQAAAFIGAQVAMNALSIAIINVKQAHD